MHDIPKQIPLANNHISVDCVVIGFDGEQLTWTKQPSGSYSN